MQRKGSWLQTFSGVQFWPLDPRPEEIFIEDIAHSLSMLCRFNGHGKHFYSVAEHSVLVAAVVPPEHKKWGLLHDAAEAYLSDIPSPVKGDLPHYRQFENHLLSIIAQRFNLPVEIPDEVFHADMVLLSTEKNALMGKEPDDWGELPDSLDPGIIKCFNPSEAELEFLRTFKELFS